MIRGGEKQRHFHEGDSRGRISPTTGEKLGANSTFLSYTQMTSNFGDFDSSASNDFAFDRYIEVRDFEHFVITNTPVRYDTFRSNNAHYKCNEEHAINRAIDVLRAFRNLWFKRFYTHTQDHFSNANPFQADFGRFRFYEAQVVASTHTQKLLFRQKFEFASISAIPHEGKLDHTQFYPLALLREHIMRELMRAKSFADCEVEIKCNVMAPDSWYIDWLDAYIEKFNAMMRDYESYISKYIDRTYGCTLDPEYPHIKDISKREVLLRYYKMGERSQFEEIQVEDFGVKPLNRYVITASDFLNFTQNSNDGRIASKSCDQVPVEPRTTRNRVERYDARSEWDDYVPSDESEYDGSSCDSMNDDEWDDDIHEPETKRVM